MNILNSKLAQQNGLLAKEIEGALVEAQALGASVGVQRMELICDQYDKVSPDIAYQWIDLNAFQQEIEEFQLRRRRMEVIHVFRNIFSLAPLILTWAALFFAVRGYEKDLALYPSDINTPFLQLWQTGFHGQAFVTFTLAAGADALFLSLYLLTILLSHELDRRAQSVAAKFIQKLRITAEKLIEVVAIATITPIRGPEDIDKVTVAVTKVVDSATKATKQLVKTTEQSIQQLVTQAEDLFSNKIAPILTSFDSNTAIFKTDLVTFQTQLSELTNNTRQLSTSSAALVANAQSYITIGQDLSTQVAHLNTTEQDVVTQLSGITGGITGAIGSMTAAATSMETATGSVKLAAEDLDHGIELTVTEMTGNVQRATAFQNELTAFQGQLSGLNTITQELVKASTALAASAQNHVNLGQTISTQVAALNTTEQGVLAHLGTIAKDMTGAANNMASATVGLQGTANSVASVAQGLQSGVQSTISQMTNNFTRATASLGQVENQLQATTNALLQAANQLSAVGYGGGGGRSFGGILGWFFGRRSHRASGTGGRRP